MFTTLVPYHSKLQTISRTARGLQRRDVEASFQLLRLQRTTTYSSGYHDIVVSGIGVGYSWAGYSTLLRNFLFGLLTDGATRTLSSPLPLPPCITHAYLASSNEHQHSSTDIAGTDHEHET